MKDPDPTRPSRALVVPARTRAGEVERLQALAQDKGAPACVVFRGRGRRRGAAEDLVAELIGTGIATVVLPSIGVLHPSSIARALGAASALLMSGLKLVSLTEAWVATADASTLAAVSCALITEEQRRASRHGSSVVLALTRHSSGAKVGRPAKPISVPPHEAQRLVSEQGWRRAARTIGTSPATLRRTLARARLVPAPRSAA